MSDLTLAPYYHPTTICLLDDNEPFLRSLDLEMPGSWALQTFSDPLVALEFLQRPAALRPLMDRCFSLQQVPGSQALIQLDLNLIEQEISHVDRFRRNSVVVVDYAMPTMNGLEFCEALDDPYIRKAMLTGVADEKVAVAAFNAGLIHRFIPKQGADPIERVRQFVTELLHEYFNQYSARLKSTLAINPPEFLVDPEVGSFIQQLMTEQGLLEYYMVADPPGFLMLKANGEIWRVAVLSESDMHDQYQQARDFGAPPEVLERLSSGSAIVFLSGLSPADYFGDEEFPWEEQLQPASRLAGRSTSWHIAIWRNAPADIDFDPATASYDAYLRSL